MKIELPEKVQQIIKTLQKAGYEAYAVGGCVRDSLLVRTPKDWDITTSAKPQEIKSLFRRTVDTGILHGTVTVMLGRDGFEVTTYRVDGAYEDNRHPKNVTFTSSLEEDLKRRDFTINAMAYNDETGLVDLFDGMGDIQRKCIRAVGDPDERFSEDALRILRALRFAAQLDYRIDTKTEKGIRAYRENLRDISAERIRDELHKLLASPHPERLRDVCAAGITEIVLNEYDALDKDKQDEVCKALQNTDDILIRLAILLCYTGSAKQILKRLKYDNETIRIVTTLTEHAMDKPAAELPAVRHLIVETGTGLIGPLLELKRALAKQDKAYLDSLEVLTRQIFTNGDCLSLKDLAVTGNDLMREFDMRPGKELGDTLRGLFDRVLIDPSLNDREKLLALVRNERE
ncbi:MAG: CCA tRNA nucleotidyltransferase [Lachnospiraceae bacterium]|nr:CCA tRNA nucleotidyltransferase [Lachnospiraceae bacterium]